MGVSCSSKAAGNEGQRVESQVSLALLLILMMMMVHTTHWFIGWQLNNRIQWYKHCTNHPKQHKQRQKITYHSKMIHSLVIY